VSKRFVKTYIRAPFLRAFFLFSLLIGALLPRRVLLFIGRGLGRTVHLIIPSERKKAVEHLKIAFPEKDEKSLRKIAKNVFINIGMNFMELLWLPKFKEKHLGKVVKFNGLETLEKIQKKNTPVIIITGHIGNWELLAAAASLKGHEASVIARKQKDEWINRKIENLRSKWNVKTIWRNGENSSRQILSVLKNRGTLALLVDQDTKIESVFVDFFGRSAYTPSGPAALSLRFNCELISAHIHRNGNRNHTITFDRIKPGKPSGNREKDILKRTQLFTKLIEDAIRECPDQWVWMHKRWKTKSNLHK